MSHTRQTKKAKGAIPKSKDAVAPVKSALKKPRATPRRPTPPTATTKKETENGTKTVKPKVDKGKGVVRTHANEKERNTTLPTSFKVVAGSYEKLLYGLEGKFEDSEGNPSDEITLKPIFIFPSHVSCVKAVAASPDGGKWLATGSTDEIVKVWDLRRRKEIGGLVQHEGSITHLSFPTRSHLVSASEDGTICIFRARDWVLLRSLKGHKGRVNSIAVHPSGKVGLSVGKDRTLRMWDLMRGKGSASTKLGKEAELVRWSQNGDRFVVQTEKTIDIYSTDMTLLQTITHPSRIQDVRFVKRVCEEGELLLVAAEDKKVTVYDSENGSNTTLPVLAELVGHTNRVKAIDILTIALPPSPSSSRTSTTILSTASSDGWIRIYDLASVPSSQAPEIISINSIAEYDTKGTRLTCCALADGELNVVPSIAKRKRAEEEDSDAEDDEDADADDDKQEEEEEIDEEGSIEEES